MQYSIIVCLPGREVCTNFKMKTSKSLSKKCTWHTQFVVFKCNWGKKCTPFSFNTPNDKKKKIIQINVIKTQHKDRKKFKPASSILLCSCIIFTSPKKPITIWYCTGSPAVLSPLHFSNPPNYGEAQINNMLLIYTRRWRYKIEIITIHVQHAGLIFNADFLFQYIFEYNQAGNKSMSCCIKCPPPPSRDRLVQLDLHKVESCFWRFSQITGPTCRMWVSCAAGCEARPACCFITKLRDNLPRRHPTLLTDYSKAVVSKGKKNRKVHHQPILFQEEEKKSLHYKQLIYKDAATDQTLHCSLYLSWHVDGEMIIYENTIWWIILLIWI